MEIVYVINEEDLNTGERCVIGVCSSAVKCRDYINEYYGFITEEKYTDIREANIEFSVSLTVSGNLGGNYNCVVEWFQIDKQF